MVYTVDIICTVNIVYTVDMVYTVETVDTVYTIQTALNCVNSSRYAYCWERLRRYWNGLMHFRAISEVMGDWIDTP